MNTRGWSKVSVLVSAGLLASSVAWVAGQQAGTAPPIDPDDIGGVVTSSKGPEAGVWVIAETNDLKTKFIRIVATDDQGRYVLPDLPRANYQVWVRGYGLVDSAHVKGTPGQRLNLTAVIAPNPQAAAQYYPAAFWLALMDGSKFTVNELGVMKENCIACHQLGDKATREIPSSLGSFKSSLDAWDRRVQSGMVNEAAGMNNNWRSLTPAQRQEFADWTDRIAAGAYPTKAPERPSGIERNVVVTEWDWGLPTSLNHTLAASVRGVGGQTVNANGRIYGTDRNNDGLMWVDPVENQAGVFKVPTRDDAPKPVNSVNLAPSPYFGEKTFPSTTMARSTAMDHLGRVWMAAKIRATQPSFCKSGSTNKFAQYFPLDRVSQAGAQDNQMAMFDPKTEKWTLIDTCWPVDHNEFGGPPDYSLFAGTTGANGVVGWVSSRLLDQTKSDEAAQGWCPAVLDTNGDGVITKPWTEPEDAIDPTKDHRVTFGCEVLSVSPLDGSLWCSGITVPRDAGHILRLELGSNPPQTCKAERFKGPPQPELQLSGERGIAVDSQGVVWDAWRRSDHVTSFDRRKCKGPLNGPKATGEHCPEGWTAYRRQGEPTFQHSELVPERTNYGIDVDVTGWSGLPKDTKILTRTNFDEAQALLPNGQFVDLAIPYPMGNFLRRTSGRIDDPKTGWKGRGMWTGTSTYTPWHLEHLEGGMGEKPKVIKIQVRPNPLAK